VHPPQPARAVLFDLDDTLFDHARAASAALARVHGQHACFTRRPFDDFAEAHARHLEELHQRVIVGDMGIDGARIERFRRLFAEAGVEPRGETLAETAAVYRTAYLDARCAVDGAYQLLAALKPHARIAIVSNNLLAEQQGKVALCRFDAVVDALVVSEEAGVAKPDPRIFDIALERIGCRASEAVMVGDSWTTDVLGARAAGIRVVWFNRTGQPTPDPGAEVEILDRLTPVDRALAVILGRSTAPEPQGSYR
jgi:HAD superfamily hydrolase (TIGR01549 family)